MFSLSNACKQWLLSIKVSSSLVRDTSPRATSMETESSENPNEAQIKTTVETAEKVGETDLFPLTVEISPAHPPFFYQQNEFNE